MSDSFWAVLPWILLLVTLAVWAATATRVAHKALDRAEELMEENKRLRGESSGVHPIPQDGEDE